jgi:translation initiation factor 1 (eIF-1/SUI1)
MPTADGKPTFHEIIASLGYANYEKHVRLGQEFTKPEYGPTANIRSQQDYAQYIQDMISHPATHAAYDPVKQTGVIYNKDLNLILVLNGSEEYKKAGTAYRVKYPESMSRDNATGKQVTNFDKRVSGITDQMSPEIVRSRNSSDIKAIVVDFANEHPFGRLASTAMASALITGAANTLEGRGPGPTQADTDAFNQHRQNVAAALAEKQRIATQTSEVIKDIQNRARQGANITDSPDGKVRTIMPYDPAQPRYEVTATSKGAILRVKAPDGSNVGEEIKLNETQAKQLASAVIEQRAQGIQERLQKLMKAEGTEGIALDEKNKEYFLQSKDGSEEYKITRNDDGTIKIDVTSQAAHGEVQDTIELSRNQADQLTKTFRSSSFSHFPGLRNFATSVVLAVGLTLGTPTNAHGANAPVPERPAVVETQGTGRQGTAVQSSPQTSGGSKPLTPPLEGLPTQPGTRTITGTTGETDPGKLPVRPATGGDTGSGGETPRTSGGGTVDTDGTGRSRWQQAVADVGGAKGMAAHVVGKAGYGISAFHLSQQLFGENSTLKSDLKNDAVRTRALTAVTLDATVFATDTVIYGANAAKYLRHLDKLDDVARLASTSSKFTKFSRAAGPVGTVISIGTSALDYSISETLEDGSRAAKAVGGGGGGLVGAGIGFVIGSIFLTPLGAAILTGATGLAGGFGGAELAEHYWADDFQEHFDEKALKRLEENLGKTKGIGDKLYQFLKIEQQAGNAYERLNTLYDATDISKLSRQQVLGINAGKLKEMDDALKSYQDPRREMARRIDSTLLTEDDQKTLDEVMQFIQERKAFLDVKEKHLRDSGDNDALARLAQERTKLAEAESEILRWKGLSDAIAKRYGASSQEGLQKAEAELAPTTKAVADRKAQVTDYQDKIRKLEAAVEQQGFEKTLTQRLDKVNKLYGSSEKDDALMQRSAALLSLVESGEIDQKTYQEAAADIGKLKGEHARDMAEMNRLKGSFQAMTKTEQEHKADPYKKDFANHNLANLQAVNQRMADITGSFKVSQDVSANVLKAAENVAAIRTIKDSGVEITGDTARKVSDHIANIAKHTTETLAILSKDLGTTAQTLHGEWGKFQSHDVVNINRYAELREQSVSMISAIDQKVEEIDRVQRSLKDTLENGYKLGEERIPLTDPAARQRVQENIDRLERLKVQYSDQSNKMLQTLEKATDDVNKRVLQRGEAVITLDRKGMVASYTVGEKATVFAADRRPMLVDANANIYNNTTSLKGAENTDFYLYRAGIVTKVGEEFQGTRAQDAAQLRTVEDVQARQQVQQTEKELTDKLKGKTIRNALSEMPVAAPPPQAVQEPKADGQPHASAAPVESTTTDRVADNGAIDNHPDYIEGAIALEKLESGEALDAMEKAALARILNSPDSDPAIVASLTQRYGDTMAALETSDTGESEGGQRIAPQTYAARTSSAYAVGSFG